MKKKSRLPWIIGFFVAVVVVCGGGLVLIPIVGGGAIFGLFAAYEYSAPPIAKIAPYLESSPTVIAALGGPVSVSMTITRTLTRELGRDGGDRVNLMTNVSGSRRDALLTAHAQNHNGQGWAGTWELRGESQRVLRDGRYVVEGADVIASGTFAPDGTPQSSR